MSDRNWKAYDTIIIGAGSIGCPTALALANAGVRVLVLDQQPSVGQGSNKNAIGGIRATHSDPAKICLSHRSIEIFSTWQENYGDEIEWVRGGYCFVAYREQEERKLKELLKIQKGFNLKIDWLMGDDMMALIPDLNPNGLLGGTYSPEDGSASPLLAIHAFYRKSRSLGVEYHFNETISKILINGNKVTGVRTSIGNVYTAPFVINSAGAWAGVLGDITGEILPVMPDSHESGVTEPVERFFYPMIVDIMPHPGSSSIYFYQHHTGQVFFCMTPDPNIWGFDCEATSTFLPMVSKRMISLMPRLQNIRVRRTWRGLYPMTPDGAPIIGWSQKFEGLIYAVGMCGQGFMLGPGVGELITRLITKQPEPSDEEILNQLSPYREFAAQEALK